MIRLPPPLRLLSLSGGSPAEHAVQMAALDAEPGWVVWRDDHQLFSMAVLLCPESGDDPVGTLGALALAEALEADGPPHMHMDVDDDGRFALNGATVGEIRVIWPDARNPGDWVVLCIEVRMASLENGMEPGATPDRTSLGEEGLGSMVATDLLQRLAHHLRYWLSVWEEDGHPAVTAAWERRVLRWRQSRDRG